MANQRAHRAELDLVRITRGVRDWLYVATAYANLAAVDLSTGEISWQSALGAGLAVHASPVVADDFVLLACSEGMVVAVNAADGARRWSYISGGATLLPGRVTGPTPAVSDGLVYAGFADGQVTAMHLETGESVWQHQTDGAVLSSPAITGDVLYVGSNDGRIRALDRRTGECLWMRDLGTRRSSRFTRLHVHV